MGQCNFSSFMASKIIRSLQIWYPVTDSCSYPRHSQLTRHSLMLANGRIRQSLTALVLCWCDTPRRQTNYEKTAVVFFSFRSVVKPYKVCNISLFSLCLKRLNHNASAHIKIESNSICMDSVNRNDNQGGREKQMNPQLLVTCGIITFIIL